MVGRPLVLEPLDNDAARAVLSMQQPPEYVDAMFDFYVKGTIDVSHVLPTVQQLLGRPGRTFREWAQAHQDAFSSGQ